MYNFRCVDRRCFGLDFTFDSLGVDYPRKQSASALTEPLKSRSLAARVAIMWVDARPHMSGHMSVTAES